MIPYVFDQLAMRRLPRETYALFVALLPATAVLVGLIVLRQIPHAIEVAGVALIVGGVALHRQRAGEVPRPTAGPVAPLGTRVPQFVRARIRLVAARERGRRT